MADKPYREKEVVQEDFDKLTDYDDKRDMYYFERRLRRLAKELPIDKDAKILDFGGGSGLFSHEIQKLGYKNLYLVDLSPIQIKQAQEKKLPYTLCGDENFIARNFTPGFFDFIFMADVIEHVEDPIAVLRKLSTVLNSKGKLVLTYPNPLWVPALNVLGNIGLKLKGKDNKIYLRKIAPEVPSLHLAQLEGHMIASKLPRPILKALEKVEGIVPAAVKKNTCILNIAVFEKHGEAN